MVSARRITSEVSGRAKGVHPRSAVAQQADEAVRWSCGSARAGLSARRVPATPPQPAVRRPLQPLLVRGPRPQGEQPRQCLPQEAERVSPQVLARPHHRVGAGVGARGRRREGRRPPWRRRRGRTGQSTRSGAGADATAPAGRGRGGDRGGKKMSQAWWSLLGVAGAHPAVALDAVGDRLGHGRRPTEEDGTTKHTKDTKEDRRKEGSRSPVRDSSPPPPKRARGVGQAACLGKVGTGWQPVLRPRQAAPGGGVSERGPVRRVIQAQPGARKRRGGIGGPGGLRPAG
jgi:hypothetical protein